MEILGVAFKNYTIYSTAHRLVCIINRDGMLLAVLGTIHIFLPDGPIGRVTKTSQERTDKIWEKRCSLPRFSRGAE